MAKIKEFKLDVVEVGRKLRDIRRENNLVQDDLASHLGVTRSSYASIERGTYGTRIEVLANIILFYQHHKVLIEMEELIGLRKLVKRGEVKAATNEGQIKELTDIVNSQRETLAAVVEEQAATRNLLDMIVMHLKIDVGDQTKIESSAE